MGNNNSADRSMDLLSGGIGKKVLAFAVPLALTSMLQQLFNAADVAVLGRFVGKTAMAAVGSNAAIIGLIVNLFIGISIGSNVVISRCTGQHDEDKVSRAVHTSIVLSVICGLMITVIGIILARPMISLLGVPADIAPMAVKYMHIYFAGMPVIMLYNFEAAIFRSRGDTKTPLIILAVSGIVNVALNFFFVLTLGLDVDGVAYATIISNLLSAALLFINLTRQQGAIRVSLKKLGIDVGLMLKMLRIGVPSGLQGVVFSISNLVVQSAVNSLGSDVVAASAASFYIEIFCFFILSAFGQATVTFIGQNYGAGKLERCTQTVRRTLAIDIGITMTACTLTMVFGRRLIGLFNGDTAVIEYGYTRMTCLLPFEWLNCIMDVLSSAMRGYGRSMIPAAVTFVGVCGSRIIWVYTVFAASPTLKTLMIIYPISWAITAGILLVLYFRVKEQAFALRENM